MKICVFGAASEHIDKIYISEVENLCESLAKRGHSLVFGGGGTGLMGAAACGFKRGGGYILGVIPEFFRDENVEIIYPECDRLIYTKNLAERKKIMEDEADAFIITPGGVGTFEEFFEVLTLKQLDKHDKAVVIFNIGNYFGELAKFMQNAQERKFLRRECNGLYTLSDSAEEIIGVLENYKGQSGAVKKPKSGD